MKAFEIQWWTGLAWSPFSPAINVVNNTDDVSYFTGLDVNTQKIKLIIYGTMVQDEDKYIKQIIWTQRIGSGQLTGWPEITDPKHTTQKKVNRMLSGKVHVTESLGAFSCRLAVKNWKIENDIDILERIYFGREGVLMWLSGNNEAQFWYAARGYRREDIYLVRPTNDWEPEFYRAVYQHGFKVNLRLEEAIY